MRKLRTFLVVMVICLIGSLALPLAGSSNTAQDIKNAEDHPACAGEYVQFKLVDDAYTEKAMKWMAENHKNSRIPEDINGQHQLLSRVSNDIQLPDNFELLFLFVRDQNTDKLHPQNIMAVEKSSTLGSNDISEVELVIDSYKTPIILFQLSNKGSVELKRLTALENRGRRLAIIVDNKIRSAPIIREQIVGGKGSITGNFTMDEAEDLIYILKKI